MSDNNRKTKPLSIRLFYNGIKCSTQLREEPQSHKKNVGRDDIPPYFIVECTAKMLIKRKEERNNRKNKAKEGTENEQRC
jgi:hypothetical protein